MAITVENVSKRFGTFQALEDINLKVGDGGLVALLGPSGSGKSTLLRLIAGLERPDTGRILLTGQDATHQSVQDRQVGFVFQHYALFKHLTIRKNIAFGLEIQKWPQERIKQRVDELLDLVQLSGLGNRYPSQLSGGQRQRIALARALAVEPKVLLLDEPFGALDAKVRKDLRDWLRRLHDEVHVTTVFVTHDQEEAMEISDEIVVMNHGHIEQVGHPAEVYDRPASPFVMSFIGAVNVVPSTSPLARQVRGNPGESIFLRPQDISIHLAARSDALPAKVIRITHLGWEIQVELGLESGQRLMALLTRSELNRLQLQPQQAVFVDFEALHTFATHSNAHAPAAEAIAPIGQRN